MENNLKDYAQYLIGQPCKIDGSPTLVILKGVLLIQAGIALFPHASVPLNKVKPLLITYDQLTNKQWRELESVPRIGHDDSGARDYFFFCQRNNYTPVWTPEQTRLLLSYGVDIFRLIEKGLAAKREL